MASSGFRSLIVATPMNKASLAGRRRAAQTPHPLEG
jgi:hypothetical protein